ncbi:MAG: diguanylate cyclase [Candidatus Adiutrix sp.]|nr:diguanylate cyclase [Candidatus Adiutrix sp.]
MTAANAKILIIDALGDVSLCAAKRLIPGGLSVLATGSPERARQLLAASRPELVLIDRAGPSDPLVWVEEIHRLGLAAQVIAVTEEPDFNEAMDWIAGGIFNVLSRPLDEDLLCRRIGEALESCRAFREIVDQADSRRPARDDESLNRSLADFYRGLSGCLEGPELKTYIMDRVKALSGAQRVELCLTGGLAGSSYCLETYTLTTGESRPEQDFSLPPAPVSGLETEKSRLGYELSADGLHLGEIYLYFDNEKDLRIRPPAVMAEIISAVSSALGAAGKYQKAVNLAARDPLTGLYNRRIFNEVLQREFYKAQRHNFNLSLLSIDLDHFKSVNDRHGHQTGDLVLKAVAGVISSVARGTDLPARLGGEEFAILLPHTSQEQALTVAGRLKNILAGDDFRLPAAVGGQTISQGVAGLEHFMIKSPEDMVYWADQALYLAKREGRDSIRAVTDLSMTPAVKDGAYAFQ